MARKPESDVSDLIKSLSKGEKKTFTLFANYYSGGDKKYLLLFTLIDAQKQYDEGKIIQKLKEAKIFTHLPSLKIYLMELILKALRFHHSEKSMDGQLRDYMADAEIYHAKRLVKLRDKTLQKAKELATRYEKHETSLQILNKEWSYKIGAARKNIFTEQKQITERLIAIRKYQYLHQRIDVLLKKGSVRDEETKKEWDEIIQDPVMDKNIEPFGFEEYYYYHHIYAMYYQFISDNKKSIYHRELMLKKVESRPDLLPEEFQKYMVILNNLTAIYVKNKDMEKAKKIMEKLLLIQDWKLNGTERNLLENQIAIAYSIFVYGYILTTDFEEGERIAEEVVKLLEDKKIDTHYKSMLVLGITTLYMYTGNYRKALTWNNTLLNELGKNYREDMDAIARVFNLIIHYELGNDDILPHIIRSTYRFMYKRKRLFKTEDAILRFIRNKLPQSNSKKDLLKRFKELETELKKIAKDPYEATASEDFDYISWLESKTTNKTMVEVLKEKNNKK